MEPSVYELENYFKKKYTKQILEEIKNFELPEHWNPKQVIDYITYKLDRK